VTIKSTKMHGAQAESTDWVNTNACSSPHKRQLADHCSDSEMGSF